MIPTIEELTVEVGGRKMALSYNFLVINGAEGNLEALKDKFRIKFELYDKMDEHDNPKRLRDFAKQIKENEFEIQELFNFDRNYAFHRWWEVPKCTCPTMDNQDWWGNDRCYISGDCPIHGGE